MEQFSAKIIKNHPVNDAFLEMEMAWEAAEIPSPGQFLTIRVSDIAIPLLRRPFAISSFDPLKITCSIIYQVRGCATEILSAKKAGEVIDVIGPMGNGFPPFSGSKALLIAGGTGLGPILFLSATLRNSAINTRFIFGCRSKTLIPQSVSFTRENPIICTDDGSEGFHGTTADYLNSIANEIDPDSAVFCCGPHPMLAACHLFALKKQIPCFVSVEQIMACGVGACMGCAVKTIDPPGYKRACKEGPVFNSLELDWQLT